eukprot:scaffold26910_cov34-Tisochrysis_lutea.AAC.1
MRSDDDWVSLAPCRSNILKGGSEHISKPPSERLKGFRKVRITELSRCSQPQAIGYTPAVIIRASMLRQRQARVADLPQPLCISRLHHRLNCLGLCS